MATRFYTGLFNESGAGPAISQNRFMPKGSPPPYLGGGGLETVRLPLIPGSFGIPSPGAPLNVIPRDTFTSTVPGIQVPYSAPASQSEPQGLTANLYRMSGGGEMTNMASLYQVHSKSYQIGDSLTTGALFVGADKLLNGQPLNQREFLKGSQSAAAEFVAQFAAPSVYAFLPAAASSGTLACNALSGAAYVLLDMIFKFDGRSALYKFLLQGGASFASQVAVYPVVARTFGLAY